MQLIAGLAFILDQIYQDVNTSTHNNLREWIERNIEHPIRSQAILQLIIVPVFFFIIAFVIWYTVPGEIWPMIIGVTLSPLMLINVYLFSVQIVSQWLRNRVKTRGRLNEAFYDRKITKANLLLFGCSFGWMLILIVIFNLAFMSVSPLEGWKQIVFGMYLIFSCLTAVPIWVLSFLYLIALSLHHVVLFSKRHIPQWSFWVLME
jgi:hypothetical protein